MKIAAVAILALSALSCSVVAQQSAPADSGPTLAVTMQFLQDKLGSQGKIRFAKHVLMSPSGNKVDTDETIEVTAVKADARACLLKYHEKSVEINRDSDSLDAKGKLIKKGAPLVVNSENVLKLAGATGIRVQTAEEAFTEGNRYIVLGVPQTFTLTIDPSFFVLAIQTSEKVKVSFYFPDQQIADRVGKAMQHAVDLCMPPPPPPRDDSRKPNEPF
jgi:hypothetical protein